MDEFEKPACPICVTESFLPPLEEFQEYLKCIWQSKRLTNNAKYHCLLEQALCEHLGVKHISLFSNGTLALITALKALKISGEVITTPFSFVATAHSLWWNNIKPVFVDIDPRTCNLDPGKIEAAITARTTAILPVHVYGNPCDVKEIQKIADRRGLKVIYDAAHAFGVEIEGNSIANFGDLSVLSFHATKVFNTFEGGAIVCHDEKTKRDIDYLKNFGFADETTVIDSGINAKMNEFQAALGLLQLKYINSAIEKNKRLALAYRNLLEGVCGIRMLEDAPQVRHNYSYFPILVNEEKYGKSRDRVYEGLKERNIFTRRYFYPLISQFPVYQGLESAKAGLMPVAERVARDVLCLPIYPDLEEKYISLIAGLIKSGSLCGSGSCNRTSSLTWGTFH